MGAHVVVPFPAPALNRCRALAAAAEQVVERLSELHLPVLSVAAELLELDDLTFAARLGAMRDAEGGALLADLFAAIQSAAADIDLAARAFFVTRARLTAGLAFLGGANAG